MNRTRRAIATIVLTGLLATTGQAATASASVVRSTTRQTYVVRAGDTLSGIAARFGSTPAAIARANRLSDHDLVVIGRRLTIPAGSSSGNSSSDGGPSTGLPAKLRLHPDRLALRPNFRHWAAHYGVPDDLLEALAWVESGWQPTVVSKTGAIGIGQLMPDTVALMNRLIGVKLDPRRADDNIRMAARFLRYLLDRTGSVPTALAAYYQGLRSVTTTPIARETKQYVATVLAFRPFFR